VTDLDADPVLLVHPVTPGSASDLGDRMILASVALNPNIDDEPVRKLAWQFSRGDRDGDDVPDSDPVNVVVLVPSDKAAQAWAPFADRTWKVGDLGTGVAQLRAGHVGLVVLVNKYDGIDLPGKACEVLVLDGIPRPMDAWERREAYALADSPGRLAREIQRIEQGMGRGVRDTEDHCAVLLLGATIHGRGEGEQAGLVAAEVQDRGNPFERAVTGAENSDPPGGHGVVDPSAAGEGSVEAPGERDRGAVRVWASGSWLSTRRSCRP
jgi:hypothetical protein